MILDNNLYVLFWSSGGDDRRVLLWHMEKAIHSRAKPVKLKGEHLSNIFCLAFDSTNKKVFSGGKSKINYTQYYNKIPVSLLYLNLTCLQYLYSIR